MKKNKNNNKYISFFGSQFCKFGVVSIISLIFFSILNINKTFTYFNDETTISNKEFSTGTLKLKADTNDLGIIKLETIKNYSIINQGNSSFKYEMTVEIPNSDDIAFCEQLNITVAKDGTSLYTGSLSGLDFTKLLAESTQDDLTILVTDPNNNPAGKICNFNIISKAWQNELDYNKGFTDNTFTKAIIYSADEIVPVVTSSIVLNEFLPNPAGFEYGFDFGKDNDNMPQGEWVELYNLSDTDTDITGWYLSDASGGVGNQTPINSDHLLAPSLPIVPAHGWLVIYMNKQTYNNAGDTVKLFDSNNNLIDSYSYGDISGYCDMEPTADDTNDTNPSSECSYVPGNKSYARIPDGTGAWVDPIPTPGEPNIDGEVGSPEKSSDPVLQEQTIETLTEEITSGDYTLEIPEEIIEESANEPIKDENAEENLNEENISTEEATIIKDEETEEVLMIELDMEEAKLAGTEVIIIEESTEELVIETPTVEVKPIEDVTIATE